MKKRVVVGMSGGVDSSVAAYLAIQAGYDVIGIFMKNWHDTSVTISEECPWLEDSNDALIVAEKLGIPFQTIDLSEQYRERIVDYMFKEYEAGRTPNPDVLCNREIKFDIFLKAAMSLGADFVATGHYCQKDTIQTEGEPIYRLRSGADKNKDQSYFLCQLSQEQLSKALFPIGHLQKSAVRAIAKEQGLITAEKRDSQGLCFIGKVRLPDFLQQQLKQKPGIVIEIPKDAPVFQHSSYDFDKSYTPEELKELSRPYALNVSMGKKVGVHSGAHYYTIGQRRGLRIGGYTDPIFVIGTNTRENIIYVGQGEQHPGLFRPGLYIPNKDLHWIREDLRLQSGEKKRFLCRVRYREDLQHACLHQVEDGLYILFEKEEKAITSGQFAAWYQEDELIGSGVID